MQVLVPGEQISTGGHCQERYDTGWVAAHIREHIRLGLGQGIELRYTKSLSESLSPEHLSLFSYSITFLRHESVREFYPLNGPTEDWRQGLIGLYPLGTYESLRS